MGHYDPIRKIAFRDDGSIAYANDYGSVTVQTPSNKTDSWSNDAARKAISDMDKSIKRRSVQFVG